MKKLALVLGSLLVVGTAATAKEVMPAPVVVPEKVVEIVEKPVIVYRDREVAPAWRPNGSVNVEVRLNEKIEGHRTGENNWKGADAKAQLRTTSDINFTENQSLNIHTRNSFGLRTRNHETTNGHEYVELTHTYNFGNLGASKVNARFETKFSTEDGKHVRVRPVFDFSEYFFKNDYVKATAIELAPYYTHRFPTDDKTKSDSYENSYGIYANFAFDLPFGVDFAAEFDSLFDSTKKNRTESHAKDKDLTLKTGKVEMTLGKTFPLYKEGKHDVKFRLEAKYETTWAYSRGHEEASIEKAGTTRTLRAGEEHPRTERWGKYTAKFEPALTYTYKATDFVSLYARVSGAYVNRNEARHEARHWRWQPLARLGFKATF